MDSLEQRTLGSVKCIVMASPARPERILEKKKSFIWSSRFPIGLMGSLPQACILTPSVCSYQTGYQLACCFAVLLKRLKFQSIIPFRHNSHQNMFGTWQIIKEVFLYSAVQLTSTSSDQLLFHQPKS